MRGALVTLSVLVASMLTNPAVGQTLRSTEIIERALQAKPDIAVGKRFYGEHCAHCHGEQGHGNADQVIPALAGQLPIYVIKQIVDLSESTRTSADMHRIVAKRPLTTQALRDIATYLGTLDPNPEPETGDGTRWRMRIAKGLSLAGTKC